MFHRTALTLANVPAVVFFQPIARLYGYDPMRRNRHASPSFTAFAAAFGPRRRPRRHRLVGRAEAPRPLPTPWTLTHIRMIRVKVFKFDGLVAPFPHTTIIPDART